MARKKKGEEGGGPNWLDTYADMVTLLLTFFVLLFAMSSMDSGKWEMLVKAFNSRGGATSDAFEQLVLNMESTGSNLGPMDPTGTKEGIVGDTADPPSEELSSVDDLYLYLKEYVESNGLESSIELHKGDDYTFMTFRDNIFFDGDSAVLQPQGKKMLDVLADAISKIPNKINEIRFYGHTAHVGDSAKPANQVFDRELSVDRATNVLLYVQLKGVISPSKLISEGYGEWRPIAPHDGTEANRRKNRRVEIYISQEGNARNPDLDEIYSDIEASSGAQAAGSKAPASSAAGSSSAAAPSGSAGAADTSSGASGSAAASSGTEPTASASSEGSPAAPSETGASTGSTASPG